MLGHEGIKYKWKVAYLVGVGGPTAPQGWTAQPAQNPQYMGGEYLRLGKSKWAGAGGCGRSF